MNIYYRADIKSRTLTQNYKTVDCKLCKVVQNSLEPDSFFKTMPNAS